jgi:hypothetical protein
MLKINYKRLFVGILSIVLVSCSSPWDDRKDSGDPNLDANLSGAIANTAEVSKFKEILVQTGYDKVLSESKTYTVFAPTNEAMAQVDPSLLDTPEKLVFFVQNHIALSSYSSIRTEDVKIKMLSNKYLVFKGSTVIDDATIITADKYAANGIFHIVNKALAPKQNIWQYVNGISATSEMSKYLLSLKEFSIYKSDSIAKANTTPGAFADSLSNSYLKNVYNINNEKNSYTLFLMEDTGYASEVTKLIPFLTKSKADSTAIYASYFTVRDMVLPKAYKLSELPAQYTTRFGVNVKIDKTQIVGEPIVLSNGIVYRMKKVDVDLKDRLVTTVIEGESSTTFLPSSLRSKVLYREKKDLDGKLFKDIAVYNSTSNLFNIFYRANDLFSMSYDVYWKVANVDLPDPTATPIVFKQSLFVGNGATTIMAFPYYDVPVGYNKEFLLGRITLTKAGDVNKIVLAANPVTTVGLNTLSLDYLKFVPVIK